MCLCRSRLRSRRLRQSRAAESSGRIANVRELSGAFNRMRAASSNNPHFINDQAEPFSIISISTTGDVSTFSPELLTSNHTRYGNFVFGNIYRDSFEAIAESPKFASISAAIARGVANCARTCGYFRVCQGGAPSNKIFENGDFETTETIYCRVTQQAVLDIALELAETFARG